MKKFLGTFFGFFVVLACLAQSKAFPLPNVEVKNIDGKIESIAEVVKNNGAPVIISLWATWCKPCVAELDNISELYPDWVEESGVKLVAVSVDDTRSAGRVKPFTISRGWEFPVYYDSNGDLKRSLNANEVPHTFLVNAAGEVVWQHTSYLPGDEYKLYEEVLKLTNQN